MAKRYLSSVSGSKYLLQFYEFSQALPSCLSLPTLQAREQQRLLAHADKKTVGKVVSPLLSVLQAGVNINMVTALLENKKDWLVVITGDVDLVKLEGSCCLPCVTRWGFLTASPMRRQGWPTEDMYHTANSANKGLKLEVLRIS